jgi:hypothetical protein
MGIKKLFGSFPFLKIKIELINKKINVIPKSNKTVVINIRVIENGLTISIPVTLPIMYPNTINAQKLNKIVINNP